jgi:exopolyphosphatase / guanosine-5'-triphosphate,3'-diphosphate pyrophosphatase
MIRAITDAQGRDDRGPPIAVVDIGSNSVRLVAYEGLTRSPTEIFNEKALCGLGREVQTTRLLAADAVQHALATLKRFRSPSPPPPVATPRTDRLSSSSRDAPSVPTSRCFRAARRPSSPRSG